jgi:hypothetical protein
LYDFAHEKTQLQHVGESLGITVDRTPKCHPEIAGEGIEYSWGCGKNRYRRLPWNEKRGKENFLKNVRECTSTKHITQELVRKFSRRARRYMLAYYKLACGLAEDEPSETTESKFVPIKIEKIVQNCKTHRCAMDFDAKFIANHLS